MVILLKAQSLIQLISIWANIQLLPKTADDIGIGSKPYLQRLFNIIFVFKQAYDQAMTDIEKCEEDQHKDSTLIMQLLRDNLTVRLCISYSNPNAYYSMVLCVFIDIRL